jgi:hypothetical protein
MPPPRVKPWLPALLVGVAIGAVTWLAYRLPPPSTADLDQLLGGARAILAGRDPYEVAGREAYGSPLFYPLPGLLLLTPFAGLPVAVARALWAGLSGFVLTLAAQEYRRGLPAALLSACFLNAAVQGQWSALLTAAVVYPAFRFVWAAKPSVGAALLCAFPGWSAVVGGLALVGLSLAIQPHWPAHWWASLGQGPHRIPLLQPGGFLLLFGLLRWRRPECRLVLGLACVPQTIGLYEALPLFLIPRDRNGGYALAILSYIAAFAQAWLFPRLPGMSLEEHMLRQWPVLLVCLYLPALVIALLPREAQPELG